ncbi:hypothetical protein GCM10022285_27230 [Streptomyces tunisiensis]|uniref:Uncharacterized protein n=1 Tax=Streptomyces tunisiensis TaxID=948699 RepID=A0ABP7YFH8_9ACTN
MVVGRFAASLATAVTMGRLLARFGRMEWLRLGEGRLGPGEAAARRQRRRLTRTGPGGGVPSERLPDALASEPGALSRA